MNKTEFIDAMASLTETMKNRISQTELVIGEATILLLQNNEPINRETLIAKIEAMLLDKPSQEKIKALNAALKHLIG